MTAAWSTRRLSALLWVCWSCRSIECEATPLPSEFAFSEGEIHAANQARVGALNRGRYAEASSGFGATVIRVDERGDVLQGRSAVDSTLRSAGQSSARSWHAWASDTVEVQGNRAYEVGRALLLRAMDTTLTYRALFWRRDADGTWRIYRDVGAPVRAPGTGGTRR